MTLPKTDVAGTETVILPPFADFALWRAGNTHHLCQRR